ncbi:ParB N-terminal domain-containing protein [Agromyces sp. SYSU K20354]|uniref:ParB/RepB/Spo0J family partition protein n=1 Tax=Agromyces cavernae TaxID=2898659 RepID=UPI001E5E0A58|nr:ParB N-terminal domain-containing protein [Agromyces cavernae]MCD2444339.1 ParB N-terminal domain-containing protein [Agromyces cavernae]
MDTETIARTAGVLEHIDPNSIVIETNVRPSAPLTPEFIASIRYHGVLVPTLGYRDEQGRVVVRAGQRRTLGAREAGIATMPIVLVDGDEDTVRRIIEQLIENEQREALTDVERAAAWQQLSFEGLSVTAIAKRTGTKNDRIKAGLAVAGSQTATAAVAEFQMNLEHAAALVEFEDDEQATAKLVEIATTRPSQFDHEVQRQRDQRELNAELAPVQANLAEQGFIVRTAQPGWGESVVAVGNLATAEGEEITIEHLTGQEGVEALVSKHWRTGEIVVQYYVTDPKALGFKQRDARGEARTPMTDEDKAERRELIANNKAWAPAEVVRRAWLTEFLSRKTLPADAAAFIATGLSQFRFDVSRAGNNGNVLAHELLGVERPEGYFVEGLAAFVESRPTKAQHVSLGIVLAAIEDQTSRETWRRPSHNSYTYFARLAEWGYALSDVEQLVIDRHLDQKAQREAEAAERAAASTAGEGFDDEEFGDDE